MHVVILAITQETIDKVRHRYKVEVTMELESEVVVKVEIYKIGINKA